MDQSPLFSVVAPMLNEAENVETMAREIARACTPVGPFEAIFVNDGSTDDTSQKIEKLRDEFPWLREVRHASSCGQSAAVRSGVIAARAPFICTIDGDGQNPPAEIPNLVRFFLDDHDGIGLVAGQRVARQDTQSKKIASRLANRLRGWMLNDDTRDTGCGLKAFPRDLFLQLPFFDHIHRYLPALVKREGYRIELIDVSHRARGAGRSKYTNFGRAVVGIQDLLGVRWLISRRKLPKVVHTDT